MRDLSTSQQLGGLAMVPGQTLLFVALACTRLRLKLACFARPVRSLCPLCMSICSRLGYVGRALERD
jgi:hypothetical protein